MAGRYYRRTRTLPGGKAWKSAPVRSILEKPEPVRRVKDQTPMSIEYFLAFNIALLAALMSPGPALLVAIRTTLSEGRSAGIAVGCGLGSMAGIWTLAALLGLEGIFRFVPWAYSMAKLAGGLYLIYIAWNTWRGAKNPVADSAKPRMRALRDGMLVNLSNPKSVLFAAAVLIVIFPPGMTMLEKGVVVLNHFLVEVSFYSLLAVAMSIGAVSRTYLGAKVFLDRFAAVVLGALGLRLLLQR